MKQPFLDQRKRWSCTAGQAREEYVGIFEKWIIGGEEGA